MGVSLNGGIPNLHPKMIIFSRKKPMGLLGKPTILGNPQIDVKASFLDPQKLIVSSPLKIGHASPKKKRSYSKHRCSGAMSVSFRE